MQPTLGVWTEYIESQVGFILPKAQYGWLTHAVQTVAQEMGVDKEELYTHLGDKAIRQRLIDATLIPESRFFRDAKAIEFLTQCYHEHIEHHHTPFLVASIGCSTGQEVWSLAMALEQKKRGCETLYSRPCAPYQIIGVDVSSQSLDVARAACYSKRSLLEIPKMYQYYCKIGNNDTWQVSDVLQNKVQFLLCNIFDGEEFLACFEPYSSKISVAICQNVLIYFRRFDQRDILGRISDLLKDDGFLVLGAGEALFWQSENVQRIVHEELNLWQKTKRS